MFSGKTVVITGASSGLGEALAAGVAEAGGDLALLARDAGKLDAVAERCRGAGARVVDVPGDVVKAGDCERLITAALEEFSSIDHLVLNAGVSMWARFEEVENPELFSNIMDTNYLGAVNCVRPALASLKTGGGLITAISSVQGITGVPSHTGYCASKHAMVGLTRTLALEVAKKGITVNAVCPAYVETGMVERGVENIQKITGMSEDDARGELAKKNPQGRIIEASEVGATVAWLCLPGSESITGQSIAMAGGGWM